MKIFYILSGYISHRQAGLEYINCLQSLGHEVACNYPALLAGGRDDSTLLAERSWEFVLDETLAEAALSADLIILHEDPAWHDKIFENLPELAGKPLVIYLPWENERLPAPFIRPLKRAVAIWTPSEFCRLAFAGAGFGNARVLPHVVRRMKPSPEGLAWARALLEKHDAAGHRVFLSVVDGLNPRKNLEGLLTAFAAARQSAKAPSSLVIKQYRAAMPLENIMPGGYTGVINVTDTLDDGHMAALYAACAAYVSAHRIEGWGLGLSAAMAFGKIAIATAYSGNMDFMDKGNSLLIPYTMAQVSQQMGMKIPLFTPEMRWAEPDIPALAEAMRQAAEGRVSPEAGRRAAEITRRFGPEAVAERLRELLALI